MLSHDDLAKDFAACFGRRHHLPEYRQVEFCSKKKKLSFGSTEADSHPQLPGLLATEMAFSLLEGLLTSAHPHIEDLPSWKKYQALPRHSTLEKIVAEVYRILRICHLAWALPDGHIELDDGLVRIRCVHGRCAQFITLSTMGLELLESFVLFYLDSFNQPHGQAYVEAMLVQYFTDIVTEIKGFNDEDRILYQFNQTLPMNRHFRFDNDNPAFRIDGELLCIEIGKRFADPARYPVDFYLVFDNVLHIIPVEALKEGRLALNRLPLWRARTADGVHLPERFRARFGREVNVVGLPMT